MAILDAMLGVKVEIHVNGSAIKEHRDIDLEEEDEYHLTRYLEATPGQEFAVRVELLPNFEWKGDAVGFGIYVDGIWVDGPLLRKSKTKRYQVSEGAYIAKGKVKRYRFANLETVNDGRIRNDEISRVQELGIIKIECDHERLLAPNKKKRPLEVKEMQDIVSEKALKGRGIDQKVELTDPQKTAANIKFYDSQPLDDTDPGNFVFHYRSLAALKSMLIIPRMPSPPPLEERDITTLSQDELRELQKKFLAMRGEKEAQVKIKREQADANPRPRKVSKPQAGDTLYEVDNDGSMRESSTATFGGPEVIEID